VPLSLGSRPLALPSALLAVLLAAAVLTPAARAQTEYLQSSATAPSSLAVSPALNGRLVLTWAAPAQPGSDVQYYKVYRSTDGGPMDLVYKANIDAKFEDRQKLAGHTYSYQVTAVTQSGEGPASAPVTTTGTLAELPCARSFDDYLHDLLTFGQVIVAPPGFDPQTEYSLPPGTSVSTWSLRDYDCVFPPEDLDSHATSSYEKDPEYVGTDNGPATPADGCAPTSNANPRTIGSGEPATTRYPCGTPATPDGVDVSIPGLVRNGVQEVKDDVAKLPQYIEPQPTPQPVVLPTVGPLLQDVEGITRDPQPYLPRSTQDAVDAVWGAIGDDPFTHSGPNPTVNTPDPSQVLEYVSPGVSPMAATTIYSQSFDSGSAPSWSLSGWWHASTCQKSSGSYSLAFNQGACPPNFDNGNQVTGGAISPSITIASTYTKATLSWKSWHQTESGTQYDKKITMISSDGGSTWNYIDWQDGTQSAWNARSLDITGYIGKTIKIQFWFDSVDGYVNSGQGWFVDDVAVVGETSGTATPIDPSANYMTEGFSSGTPGWALSGQWHADSCKNFDTPPASTYSLAFNRNSGCPSNFDTGARVSGDAISPAFSIPASTKDIKLRWQSFHETESGTAYDQKTVWIRESSSTGAWTLLQTEDGTQDQWNSREVSLADSYAGKVWKLKFTFDSVDSVANTGQGWFVDDIWVLGRPPASYTTACPSGSTTTVSHPNTVPDLCNGPRKGAYSGITITLIVPATSDPEYDSACSPSGFLRSAADRYQSMTAVPFTVACVAGGTAAWYTMSAATMDCNGSGVSDSAGSTTNTGKLHNRLVTYASNMGLINQKNQMAFGWIKVADNAGIGCFRAAKGVAFNAHYRRDCIGSACTDWQPFGQTDLATHELGHNFGADHYPNETWKWVCASTWDGSIMNYGCMAGGVSTGFDSRTQSVTYWNIKDIAP